MLDKGKINLLTCKIRNQMLNLSLYKSISEQPYVDEGNKRKTTALRRQKGKSIILVHYC